MFLSPPLTHDLRISGTPLIDIRASLSKTQTNLSAFLVDYGGDVLRVNRTSDDGAQNLTTTSCWGDPRDRESTTPVLHRRRRADDDADDVAGLEGHPRFVEPRLAVLGLRGWASDRPERTSSRGRRFRTISRSLAGHQVGIVIGDELLRLRLRERHDRGPRSRSTRSSAR